MGTLEKYRRNGYSSAVLRDAVGYMADEGYDLGLLFTSIQPFYARLGWAPFPQTNFEIRSWAAQGVRVLTLDGTGV